MRSIPTPNFRIPLPRCRHLQHHRNCSLTNRNPGKREANETSGQACMRCTFSRWVMSPSCVMHLSARGWRSSELTPGPLARGCLTEFLRDVSLCILWIPLHPCVEQRHRITQRSVERCIVSESYLKVFTRHPTRNAYCSLCS